MCSERLISLFVHADRGEVDRTTGRIICAAEKLAAVWTRARGIPAKAQARGIAAKAFAAVGILGDGRPDGAVAFPGAGLDLCTRATALGIKLWRPIAAIALSTGLNRRV